MIHLTSHNKAGFFASCQYFKKGNEMNWSIPLEEEMAAEMIAQVEEELYWEWLASEEAEKFVMMTEEG